MTDKINVRLKGHESFLIREGWLTKGMEAVEKDKYVFSKFFGADALGIGSNMAKSLRYWLKACKITEERQGKGTESLLTENLGKIIHDNDLYLEDIFTLWILHINLVENASMATVWYLFFNKTDVYEFAKEEIINLIRREYMKYSRIQKFSERSLVEDCSVLLNMYSKEKDEEYDPEDKTISPFTNLKLLKFNGKIFSRKQPEMNKLHKLAVLYLINPAIISRNGASIEELLMGENGAMKILNLKGAVFNEYLDSLAEDNYITINRTSGLNMVYSEKGLGRSDILKIYYKKGKTDEKRNN